MNTTQRLLTESEAGAILGLTSAETLRLARSGQIPCVTLPGGEVRFVASDLWGWVASRAQPPNAKGGERDD